VGHRIEKEPWHTITERYRQKGADAQVKMVGMNARAFRAKIAD
jgi:hypothetical protein